MYRSRIDIFAEILRKAKMPTLKTHMMYSIGLSYQQLSNYIPLLQDYGLLIYNVHNTTFSTTERGRQYIEVYDQLSEMFIAPAQVCV